MAEDPFLLEPLALDANPLAEDVLLSSLKSTKKSSFFLSSMLKEDLPDVTDLRLLLLWFVRLLINPSTLRSSPMESPWLFLVAAEGGI